MRLWPRLTLRSALSNHNCRDPPDAVRPRASDDGRMNTRPHRRRRRWPWVMGIGFLIWTAFIWGSIGPSHQAYLACRAHPGPGISDCVDGGELERLVWYASSAFFAVVAGISTFVALARHMLRSVDEAVDAHSS